MPAKPQQPRLLSLRAVCDRNQGTCDNLSATAPVATAAAVTPTATACKVGGCSLFGGHRLKDDQSRALQFSVEDALATAQSKLEVTEGVREGTSN